VRPSTLIQVVSSTAKAPLEASAVERQGVASGGAARPTGRVKVRPSSRLRSRTLAMETSAVGR
jgi:hypothetical protein